MHLPAAVIYHFRIYLVNPFDQLRSEYFLWSSISFQHTIFQYINLIAQIINFLFILLNILSLFKNLKIIYSNSEKQCK